MKDHSDSKNKYTEEDIIKMLEFLVDNIFVVFAGKVFQQIISILVRSGIHTFLALAGEKRLASQFNFTYRYIDDV